MLTFSNILLKLFTLKNRFLTRAKVLHSMRMCLTVQGDWHVTHCGGCSFSSLKEWVSLVSYKEISGYYDLFSWFSDSWSLFTESVLDLEEFILYVIIPALLPFCVKEFVNFEFQVSIWDPEYIGGGVRSKPDLVVESALSFLFTVMQLGIQHIRISLLFDIESNLHNSLIIRGFSNFCFYFLMIVRPKTSLRIW